MAGYKNFPIPPGFKSDGCTVPWYLFFLAPFMWGFEDSCRWHDWARRHLVHYEVLTVPQADDMWHAYMLDIIKERSWVYQVLIGKPTASFAWYVVRLTRSRFRRTQPVPEAWVEYLEPKE